VIKEHTILSTKTLSVTNSKPSDAFNPSLYLFYELLKSIKKGISYESQERTARATGRLLT
jgi:hypothetical protein